MFKASHWFILRILSHRLTQAFIYRTRVSFMYHHIEAFLLLLSLFSMWWRMVVKWFIIFRLFIKRYLIGHELLLNVRLSCSFFTTKLLISLQIQFFVLFPVKMSPFTIPETWILFVNWCFTLLHLLRSCLKQLACPLNNITCSNCSLAIISLSFFVEFLCHVNWNPGLAR